MINPMTAKHIRQTRTAMVRGIFLELSREYVQSGTTMVIISALRWRILSATDIFLGSDLIDVMITQFNLAAINR